MIEYARPTLCRSVADYLNCSCRFSAVAQAQLGGTQNARKDSGYDGAASSTVIHEPLETNSSPSPNPRITSAPSSSTSSSPPPKSAPASQTSQPKKNGAETNKQELKRLKSAGSLLPLQLGRTPSVLSGSSACKKDKKNAVSGSRFTIYKANKASKKKREKSSAKKERKATKTLAIVLGTFYSSCHHLTSRISILCSRCILNLLAAVLHLQHHGRNLHKADDKLSTGCHSLHRDLLARLHEQLRKSRDLHCVQSRISQSFSQIGQLLDESLHLKRRLSWKEEQRDIGQSNSSTLVPAKGIYRIRGLS